VLLGDAAGYVDALTGEGLTLALRAAAVLGRELPGVLARGATRDSLQGYERAVRRDFASYERFTRLILFMARRPALRRRVIRGLSSAPWLFEVLLRHGSI